MAAALRHQTMSGGGGESTLGLLHAFPRALQRTTEWRQLLNGREAGGGPSQDGKPKHVPPSSSSLRYGRRPGVFFHCGASIKLRGARATIVAQLRRGGFPCEGPTKTSLSAFASALFGATFAWSPPGHGWSNHREMEILLAGAVPVVEFHPSFLELYRGLPVVQVADWSKLTPAVLEVRTGRRSN